METVSLESFCFEAISCSKCRFCLPAFSWIFCLFVFHLMSLKLFYQSFSFSRLPKIWVSLSSKEHVKIDPQIRICARVCVACCTWCLPKLPTWPHPCCSRQHMVLAEVVHVASSVGHTVLAESQLSTYPHPCCSRQNMVLAESQLSIHILVTVDMVLAESKPRGSNAGRTDGSWL